MSVSDTVKTKWARAEGYSSVVEHLPCMAMSGIHPIILTIATKTP